MTGGNIILIVDDAELNREIIAEAFGDEFIILQAENGVQAMKILRGHRRNLAAVFLDIMMPVDDDFVVEQDTVEDLIVDCEFDFTDTSDDLVICGYSGQKF